MRRLLPLVLFAACSSPPPPPPPPAVAPPPAAPSGPTRTDFGYIAKKLLQRCVAGGWIDTWRSTHEDVDVARPRIRLTGFEDKTGQDLDPSYLQSVLAQRMRLSGVFEMVGPEDEADFDAKGVLHRLAERAGGDRISVYTARLKLVSLANSKTVYGCEATVKGEM